MKSLLLTFDFPPIPGGISTVFYNVWRCLPAREHAVCAPAHDRGEVRDASYGQPVYRVPVPLGDALIRKTIRTVAMLWRCGGILRREKVGMLVCGQPVSIGMIGLFYKKLRHIPYCVFVYGGEEVKYRRNKQVMAVLRMVLENAESIIVNSEFTRSVYLGLGVPSEKIVSILPAVDTERFRPDLPVDDLVVRHGLRGKRVLLTVARLSERKGHDTVIRALTEIRQEVPDTVYMIVGTGPDRARLEKIAVSCGVDASVIFAGYVAEEELARYYNLCDVYVMPNREVEGVDTLEGFGISFIDASACAKPVIGGRSGGSCEAVVDGVTGYLVDPEDADAVARVTVSLLRDGVRAAEMGRAGRARVCQDFQWRQRAEKLRPVLERGGA